MEFGLAKLSLFLRDKRFSDRLRLRKETGTSVKIVAKTKHSTFLFDHTNMLDVTRLKYVWTRSNIVRRRESTNKKGGKNFVEWISMAKFLDFQDYTPSTHFLYQWFKVERVVQTVWTPQNEFDIKLSQMIHKTSVYGLV